MVMMDHRPPMKRPRSESYDDNDYRGRYHGGGRGGDGGGRGGDAGRGGGSDRRAPPPYPSRGGRGSFRGRGGYGGRGGGRY